MENAVQALLIVAGVLIGIMILSLGVALFSSLSGFVEEVKEEMEVQEIQQFNEQFLKYINCSDPSSNVEFELTIQDIVTAANTAYENNLKYGLTERNESNFYVTINLTGHMGLEQTINVDSSEILEQGLGKKYRCSRDNVEVNSQTGRVCEVTFVKIPE